MTVTTERPSAPPPVDGVRVAGVTDEDPRRSNGKLLDVQGLRALAVLLVILNHLTGWPSGGFVGVDVFFVISGFVITNSLTSADGALQPLGRYLVGFYAKRVRRLIPAALVTTVVTIAVAYALLDATRAHDILIDGVWATAFSANWHFIDVGTDYFAAAGPASPFEHYWSLSVEEQFYVVWPLLIFAAMTARRRGRTHSAGTPTRATSVVVAIVVTSVVWAWFQTAHSPVAAYFSTLTRAWELGAGAALALVIPTLRRSIPPPALLSWSGLALIVVSAFLIDGATPFPAPGAIAPVIGSALVIAAATTRTAGVNPLLRLRGAVALGDASYAAYLVHLPVIVFAAALLPGTTEYRVVSSAMIIAGATVVLHLAVERPFMRGGHGAGPRRRKFRVDALAGGLGLVLLGSSVTTLWPGDGEALAEKTRLVNAALARAELARATAASPEVGPRADALQASLRSALQQTTWPTMDPSVAAEEDRQPVPSGLLTCGDIALRAAPECSFGDRNATQTAYVIGDSTSMAYAQAFRTVIGDVPGWRVRIAGAYGCSFDSVLLANADEADVEGCSEHNNALVDEINRVRPDVVFVTNTYTDRIDARTGTVLSDVEWTAAVSAAVRRLPASTKVVLVEPAPLGPATVTCHDPDESPVSCVYRVPVTHRSRAQAEQTLAAGNGWSYISSEAWFCDTGTGYCPAFAGSALIKHDTVHVSYAYDDVIAPVMGEAFRAAGVLA